jgi:hypothetical protein
VASTHRRIVCGLLDVLALPLVAAGRRRATELLGEPIPLHYEFRRWAWRTERCVEIALGRRFLAAHQPANVLEVGNVMPLAGFRGHSVLDKYEMGEGVINEDIVGFTPGRSYSLVLSLSTLEHVGLDEEPQDLNKAANALLSMAALVEPDGALVVTIPVGYHRRLEQTFTGADSVFDSVTLLVKTSRMARWEHRPLSLLDRLNYGAPYACGNGLLVGVRGDPLKRHV